MARRIFTSYQLIDEDTRNKPRTVMTIGAVAVASVIKVTRERGIFRHATKDARLYRRAAILISGRGARLTNSPRHAGQEVAAETPAAPMDTPTPAGTSLLYVI